MRPHLYESGAYRDSSRQLVRWAVADAVGRLAEVLPERVKAPRACALLDSTGVPLHLRGVGSEYGIARLVVLRGQAPSVKAAVLAYHPRLRFSPGSSSSYTLSRVEFPMFAQQAWQREGASFAVLCALFRWRELEFSELELVQPPLPTGCVAAEAAPPYEYPSKRMLAEWLKGECLDVPSDPSLAQTLAHHAGRLSN